MLDYPLVVLEALSSSPGLALPILSIFVAMYFYADADSPKVKLLVGIFHGFLHITLFLGLAIGFRILNSQIIGWDETSLIIRFIFALEMIFIGGFFGGFIFGLYLLITSLIFKMHTNDASSALRLRHYRNFLRLKLSEDNLTIYPIGLENVPSRKGWIKNTNAKKGRPHSVFKSVVDLKPFLIEPPIVVSSSAKIRPISKVE